MNFSCHVKKKWKWGTKSDTVTDILTLKKSDRISGKQDMRREESREDVNEAKQEVIQRNGFFCLSLEFNAVGRGEDENEIR